MFTKVQLDQLFICVGRQSMFSDRDYRLQVHEVLNHIIQKICKIDYRIFKNTKLTTLDVVHFFQLSYFLHTAETSLVLHFGKTFSIKLVINFLDNFKFCQWPSSGQPAPNLYMFQEIYDQTQSKIKIFFEGDIIRHLLWGRCEINIEFLNFQYLRMK